jgi:hypothetical protein
MGVGGGGIFPSYTGESREDGMIEPKKSGCGLRTMHRNAREAKTHKLLKITLVDSCLSVGLLPAGKTDICYRLY